MQERDEGHDAPLAAPRLSARMMNMTYFTGDHDDQRPENSDSAPKRLASLTGIGWFPAKTSFTA